MKKLLILGVFIAAAASSSAFGADLPVPSYEGPPAYAPLPIVYRWTGCYVGLEGGGAFGQSQHVDGNPGTPAVFGLPITNNFNTSGGLAGGTLGCNYQLLEGYVYGVENDLSWANLQGSGNDVPPFIAGTTSTTKETWLDTLRGRAGYAWDRLLVYGTAGVAFAGVTANVCGPAGLCGSESQTRTGWVAGGGVEWAAWTSPRSSVTLKLEYLYVDLGTASYFSSPVPLGAGVIATRNVSLTNNIIRAGVNWKFNWF